MWPHKDGKGFSLELELMPSGNGRIALRAYEPDDKQDSSSTSTQSPGTGAGKQAGSTPGRR